MPPAALLARHVASNKIRVGLVREIERRRQQLQLGGGCMFPLLFFLHRLLLATAVTAAVAVIDKEGTGDVPHQRFYVLAVAPAVTAVVPGAVFVWEGAEGNLVKDKKSRQAARLKIKSRIETNREKEKDSDAQRYK